MNKKAKPAWLTLALITLVAALLLSVTNFITEPVIAVRAQEAADASRQALLAEAESFREIEPPVGDPLDSAYEGLRGDEPVGYVVATTVGGYGGDIEIMCGLAPDGTLTGVTVGGASFSETAGLGDKARSPEFTEQFKGKAVPLTLGGDIDAISGATITSAAVTTGVNDACAALLDAVSAE